MLSGIRWNSLRTKIIVWAFVPTAIILVAVAWITLIAYQRVTEDLVIERDQELTRLSTGEFAAGLTEYTGLLTEYTGLLADLARTAYIYENDPAAQRDALRRARNRFEVFDGGVLILNNQGVVVAAEPERSDALGQNWSNRFYFRQMLRSLGPVFSDVVDDGPDGTEVIVVAVPIKGDQGQFLGIMAGMFRLGPTTVNPFYGDISRLRVGKSGSAYLVDGNGRVIYHSDPGRIGDNFSPQAAVQEVLTGQVGALRTHDLNGRDIVASFAPVPGTTWGLITEESWATLIRPSQGYRRFLLLLLVLGVAVPAFVVTIGIRRITSPITELIRASQAVADGDFRQTITADTGDEVEELAEQFNLMAAQLQESYSNLEGRVADRTKELTALNAIAAEVGRSLDLQEILNNALDKTLEVVGIEAGGIYLLDEETGALTVATHQGLSPQFVAEIDGLKVGEGFSGRVVQSGQPLVVRNVSTDPRLTRVAAREEGLHSLVSVPLSAKGQVQGALFAATYGHREFTCEDVQLLTSIGNHIGMAIENAHLFEAERRRRQEATLLAEMAKLISGTLDLDEVLQLAAEYAVEVFDVRCCCILLYNEGKGTLRPAVQVGFDDPAAAAIAGVEFTTSEGMRRRVFEDLQPLIVEDVPSEPYLSPQHLLDLQSALVVPIEVGGRRLGAMQLGTHRPRHFTDDEGELALALANQAAVAIENARLFEDEQRRAEQFRVISEVGRRMTSILAVDELLDQLAGLIRGAFHYYQVSFGLIEGNNLVSMAGAGPLRDAYRSLTLKVGQQGIGGWVAYTGEPLLVPDVRQEPQHYVVPEASEIRSELCVPLKAKDALIGVLDVQSDRLDAFDESDLMVLQALANQAAIAIENARLYEQAQQVAVLEERQRLARDLHDSVSQALYGVTLYAKAAAGQLSLGGTDIVADHLRELQDTAQEALAEMRLLIHELRPPILEEAGLVAALQARLQAVEGRAGLKTTFKVEGESQIPPETEEGLYRIAQEALNNALRHAQAQNIAIYLHHAQRGQRLVLEIVDDGIGFDLTAAREQGGVGLSAMEERAAELGGRMTVKSEPGRGTTVRVEIGD